MGLTLRPQTGLKTYTVFYEIRDEDGNRFRHCGSERDRDVVLDQYPTFTAHKVVLPQPPLVVDVVATELEPELALPESQAIRFEP